MNILFVGQYPDEYNKYRNVFFQNLIFAIADAGVNCTVISPIPVTKYRSHLKDVSRERIDHTSKGSSIRVMQPRYVSLSCKRIGSIHTGIYSEMLFEKAVLQEAKRLNDQFDAVYGHFFLMGGLAAIRLARKKKLPVFVAYGECSYETEVVRLYRPLRREDIEGLRGIIAVSSNSANVLEQLGIFDGIPIIVAPNSVDMKLFFRRDKLECRKILGLPEDKFLVGFVGGFIERKGDKRLLEAVTPLDDIYCVFAGRGKTPPMGEKVLFCQAIEHDQIPILLNAVDVFCLPTQNEGSCNALVEAAACGLPVISSDLPFNDDLLTVNNSIRIDPNSIEQIRDAIARLKNDCSLRMCISEQIYMDAQQFNISKRCDRILNFIKAHLQ